ncbi:chromatin assembly factor 1 subunit A-domain-containing protein [Ampelomyces quisqualis]|uniref:Chromatin assembly factor 1 subunit A-domain-containing protein n=1 Tax=Ampelomyces quisqualis TaxID=50730 RepID=A0A6A5QWG5_AMPQU|nr:chromatin assembly factor 1 subunit A-domain-containing protein [Ampelomyces quisqualis]
MEDPTLPAPFPQKRPLDEDTEASVSTPVKTCQSATNSPLSVRSVQTPSPFKNNATPNMAAPGSSATAPASSAAQPAKRRKLTQQEKDEQRLEKAAKAKARADKKAQKEAEDKLKEEEKQKKAEEREEKRRQKEEEQQQKEEEKAKKERSQMRLNAFFVKPKATGVSPGKVSVESSQNPTSSTSLLPESSGTITNSASPSPQKSIVNNAKSDYERFFLPFNIPAHTILAPKNAFMEDAAKMQAARTRLDMLIAKGDVEGRHVKSNFKSHLPCTGPRGLETTPIVEIIERVNNSSDQPIDLTEDDASQSRRPLDMLKQIPMKYIHFGEDVRPPYYGTYTKSYTDMEATRLARNPSSRLRQDTNYEYDSEAEWEEPEEGEDLDSEGDDDADEEAEDDMDGFLDDEEDPQVKRRLISGDLQPISTGLCWQDGQGVSRLNDGSGAICTDFREYSMGFLLQPQPHAIDPFSTAYWTPEPSLVAATTTTSKDASGNGSMNPPRAPLAQRTMNGLLNTFNTPQQTPSSTASKPAKTKRTIPPEQLSAFKAEIDGKDLTKIGMVEALKKVFPKLPKDAITNTLSVVAARVGPTEKEKRWVLINT